MFVLQCQAEIRDINIKNHVFNTPEISLVDDILCMIDDDFCGSADVWIMIDNDFPTCDLVRIMRPYLYLWYICEYYISGTEKYHKARKMYKNVVKGFVKYNKVSDNNYLYDFGKDIGQINQSINNNLLESILILIRFFSKWSIPNILV